MTRSPRSSTASGSSSRQLRAVAKLSAPQLASIAATRRSTSPLASGGKVPQPVVVVAPPRCPVSTSRPLNRSHPAPSPGRSSPAVAVDLPHFSRTTAPDARSRWWWRSSAPGRSAARTAASERCSSLPATHADRGQDRRQGAPLSAPSFRVHMDSQGAPLIAHWRSSGSLSGHGPQPVLPRAWGEPRRGVEGARPTRSHPSRTLV